MLSVNHSIQLAAKIFAAMLMAFIFTACMPVEEPDADGDGAPDTTDNCPAANPGQADDDGDGIGDACDDLPGDFDNDGVDDEDDICPFNSDPEQENNLGDAGSVAVGDACEDQDNDGVVDAFDNCINVANPEQELAVGQNLVLGDACDDEDSDGVFDIADNCPRGDGDAVLGEDEDFVTDQRDSIGIANGVADVCDDQDGDRTSDYFDNCPLVYNLQQFALVGFKSERGDVCDDEDGDGVVDIEDDCPTQGTTNDCAPSDIDNDGVPDVLDSCPNYRNNGKSGPEFSQENTDICTDLEEGLEADGIFGALQDPLDKDGNELPVNEVIDNCPTVFNPDQLAGIGINNTKGDACDDEDGDNLVDALDLCPTAELPNSTPAFVEQKYRIGGGSGSRLQVTGAPAGNGDKKFETTNQFMWLRAEDLDNSGTINVADADGGSVIVDVPYFEFELKFTTGALGTNVTTDAIHKQIDDFRADTVGISDVTEIDDFPTPNSGSWNGSTLSWTGGSLNRYVTVGNTRCSGGSCGLAGPTGKLSECERTKSVTSCGFDGDKLNCNSTNGRIANARKDDDRNPGACRGDNVAATVWLYLEGEKEGQPKVIPGICFK